MDRTYKAELGKTSRIGFRKNPGYLRTGACAIGKISVRGGGRVCPGNTSCFCTWMEQGAACDPGLEDQLPKGMAFDPKDTFLSN